MGLEKHVTKAFRNIIITFQTTALIQTIKNKFLFETKIELSLLFKSNLLVYKWKSAIGNILYQTYFAIADLHIY